MNRTCHVRIPFTGTLIILATEDETTSMLSGVLSSLYGSTMIPAMTIREEMSAVGMNPMLKATTV